MSTQPAAIPPRTELGHYVIQCHVGRGAFGDVYRAHHKRWPERLVAIKVPRDPRAVEMLIRAGTQQGRLRSPHVVQVLDLEASGNTPHLVLEWVEGESLAQRLRRAPLSEAEAARVLGGVLDGLDQIHAAGASHGDLKPSNVLLATDGRVLLTDFGYGPPLPEGQGYQPGLDCSVASEQLGSAVGTLAYLAPEQREGKAQDASADLYALGVMLFESLTGRLPALADQLPDANANQLYARLCAPASGRLTALPEVRAALATIGQPPAKPSRWGRKPRAAAQPTPAQAPTPDGPFRDANAIPDCNDHSAQQRRALWLFAAGGVLLTGLVAGFIAAVALTCCPL